MAEVEGPQFDRAEFETTQSQCASCNTPLAGFYYDVNGQTVCEACRYQLEARLTGGSAGGRMLRAIGAGLLAAIAGSLLYYAIAAMTGYEFGLIAVFVGYAVGAAVRWGSNARGGWAYQTLAMALTYFAIVTTYIPPIIQAARQAEASEAQTASAASTTDATASATPAVADAAAASADPAASSAAAVEPPSAGMMVVAIALLLFIAALAPFLAGFQNIIGLIIIGIGLYEAWKLNRRVDLTITGPHALRSAATV